MPDLYNYVYHSYIERLTWTIKKHPQISQHVSLTTEKIMQSSSLPDFQCFLGSSITILLLLLGWLLLGWLALGLLLGLGGAQKDSLSSIDACYDKNQSLNGLLRAG